MKCLTTYFAQQVPVLWTVIKNKKPNKNPFKKMMQRVEWRIANKRVSENGNIHVESLKIVLMYSHCVNLRSYVPLLILGGTTVQTGTY